MCRSPARFKASAARICLLIHFVRSVNDDARDVAHALMDTPAYQQPRDDRKGVDIQFANFETCFETWRLAIAISPRRSERFSATATATSIAQNLK